MNMNKRYITSALAGFLGLALLISCGDTSRYKADEFGAKHEGKMDKALANIDRAMGDMQAAKARGAKKQGEALAKGKKLFNDTELGGNSQSCNSCHPGGGTTGGEAHINKKMGHGPYDIPIPSLVGASARFPKFKVPNNEIITLAHMNNNCIRMFLNGKRMPLNSPESFYLATYVSSLSNDDEIQVSGTQ